MVFDEIFVVLDDIFVCLFAIACGFHIAAANRNAPAAELNVWSGHRIWLALCHARTFWPL